MKKTIAVVLAIALMSFTGLIDAHAQSPAIHVSPNPVQQGQKLQVVGMGFSPGATYTVTFAASPPVKVSVQAGGSGGLNTGLTVPDYASAGRHPVGVYEGNRLVVRSDVTVISAAPVANLSWSSVVPGHDVTVSGHGYAPDEALTITLTTAITGSNSKQTKTVSVRTGNNGNFSATLTVPVDATPDQYTVYVAANGHNLASVPLKIVPGLALSNPVFTAGAITSTTITGAGFGSSQSVQVSYTATTGTTSTTIEKSITTNNNGTFSSSLNIPSTIAPGGYKVTATSTNNQRVASTTLRAVRITLSTSTVDAGQKVTIYGKGFTPNSTRVVHLQFKLNGSSNLQSIVVQPRTDQNGNFTATVTVPNNAQPGTYTVHVGTSTNASDLTHATLTVKATAPSPAIVVNTSSTRAGGTVTVSGQYFGANSDVSLSATISKLGGGALTVTKTAHTDNSGAFSIQFAIPTTAAPGNITIRATGSRNSVSVTASTALTILATQPVLKLSVSSSRPGQTLTIDGSGFSADAAINIHVSVPLYGGSSKNVAVTTRTGPAGNFSTHLTLPGRAAPGTLTIYASGPTHQVSTHIQVQNVSPSLSVSPNSVVPGSTVTVLGSGYLSGATVNIQINVQLTNGSTNTLRAAATTGSNGSFSKQVRIPGNVRSGGYTITGTSSVSGRTPSTHLNVVKLSPSLVVSPTATAPGSRITVNGFGFAPNASVTLTLHGQKLTTVNAGRNGQFSTQVSVPQTLASGNYTIQATSQSKRTASRQITINRAFNTHYYFSSLYTGHQEYLTLLNPTSIAARVTITYQTTSGRSIVKSFQLGPNRTYTRNVNTDLGAHVSAAAEVTSDVAIAVSRVNFQSTSAAIVPGNVNQATIWYFATGNTGGKYREYLALQNTTHRSVQVSIQFLPQGRKPFTLYRTLPATSRKTLKINNFVKHDAVGLIVRSQTPIVANRTIKVLKGVTSKAGITGPSATWYFAGGSHNAAAHEWLNITNPNNKYTYTTITAYGPFGATLRVKHRWLKPNARVGIFVSQFAGRNDVAFKVTGNRPLIAEEMTYVGRDHAAETDVFGVRAATTTRLFPAIKSRQGSAAGIELFNPNNTPAPILLQFMSTNGQVIKRTYVVNPLNHVFVDINTIVPNATAGVVATSSRPFVALGWSYFNSKFGAAESTGITP